jgi:hypothetical protein
MAVREFDGTDDYIGLDNGAVGALVNGAFSLVVIAKPASLSAFEQFLGMEGGGTHLGGLYDSGSGKIAFASATYYDDYFASGMTAGDWQILAITKATGTVAPRMHRKQLGSGSWTHGSPSSTHAPVTTAVALFQIGARGTVDYKDFRIAVAAVFDTELSDALIESIQTTPSTQKLADLGAVALWDLNQASTGTAVVDLTGDGADQTTITGTTVVTGDDPPGWTFGVSGGGTPPANTVAPALSGTAEVGQTLTCSTGTWTGDPTITYAYQWKRDGVNISGATANTYLLDVLDEGENILCTVTATNGVGSDSEDSNTVVPTAGSGLLVLTFDGSDDYIGGVGQGAMNGAMTVAALARRSSVTTNDTVLATGSSTPSSGFAFGIYGSDNLYVYNDNDANVTANPTTALLNNIWWLIVMTRGSGETPRLHFVDITVGTWIHEPGGNPQTTNPDSASGGFVDIGRFNLIGTGIFDYFFGEIALVGWWDGVEMSDAQVEELAANLRTSDWHSHSVGAPSSLTELTDTTPADLEGLVTWTIHGPTDAGASPDDWTFDGIGSEPGTDDLLVKVGGTWVATDFKVKVGGSWV